MLLLLKMTLIVCVGALSPNPLCALVCTDMNMMVPSCMQATTLDGIRAVHGNAIAKALQPLQCAQGPEPTAVPATDIDTLSFRATVRRVCVRCRCCAASDAAFVSVADALVHKSHVSLHTHA